MSLLRYILPCLLLARSHCQAQSDGGRITTAKGGTLQPWLVGLAAVTGFLFIVFVLLIVKRVFFKKEKRNREAECYENKAMTAEVRGDKQTTERSADKQTAL